MQPLSALIMRPHLFALEETLLVAVGDVQRQSQDPRSVLHALNEIIQSSPARSLQTHRDVSACIIKMCVSGAEFCSKCP